MSGEILHPADEVDGDDGRMFTGDRAWWESAGGNKSGVVFVPALAEIAPDDWLGALRACVAATEAR